MVNRTARSYASEKMYVALQMYHRSEGNFGRSSGDNEEGTFTVGVNECTVSATVGVAG